MVPGSRVNHPETSPPLIEIQVYHFSAAQGGFIVASTETSKHYHENSDYSGTVVVAKCFIDTAMNNPKPTFGLLSLLWVICILGLLPTVIAIRSFRRKLLLSGPVV